MTGVAIMNKYMCSVMYIYVYGHDWRGYYNKLGVPVCIYMYIYIYCFDHFCS